MTTKMKLTAVSMLALAAALVGSVALAERGMQDRGEMRGMGPMAAFDFAAVDADADGKITAEEFAAHRAAETAALDTDKDGLISAAELAAHRMRGMEARATAQAEAMVARLDSDGDGKLSAAELATRPMPARMFDRLDADGDGAVSAAEMEAAKARMAEAPRGRGDGQGKRHGHCMGHGRTGNN